MKKVDIQAAVDGHRQALAWLESAQEEVQLAIARVAEVLAAGGRVFVCGNGGSASDAQHFAAELTGRYKQNRPGYAAIALTTDSSALTAIGNDFGFEQVFSRQLEALGSDGDLLLAISTSGNSGNVVKAVETARAMQIYTLGLLGGNGGKLAGMVDSALTVQAGETARVQEMHILILHLICEAFEPA